MRDFIFLLVAMLVVAASAFVPATSYVSQRSSSSSLRMGLFDGIFGGGTATMDNRVVEASHILLSGPNASEECEKMKVDIYNDALGWFGKAENGVEPEKLVKAVSIAKEVILLEFLVASRTATLALRGILMQSAYK